MYTYKSSAELKSLAKGDLLGKYGTAIPVFLVYFMLSWILNMILAFVADTSSIPGIVVYYILTFLGSLFTSILLLGTYRFYMNLVSGRQYKVTDVFYGFKYHPDKMILITLIQTLLILLCMVPCIVFLILYFVTDNVMLLLAATILGIIGFAGGTIINLNLSQAYYLLLEFPAYSAKELLKASRDLMKGHKGRLFYIQISFLPLALLACLSCGIALLWIMPYMQATYTHFYFDIIRGRQAMQAQEHINVAV